MITHHGYQMVWLNPNSLDVIRHQLDDIKRKMEDLTPSYEKDTVEIIGLYDNMQALFEYLLTQLEEVR